MLALRNVADITEKAQLTFTCTRITPIGYWTLFGGLSGMQKLKLTHFKSGNSCKAGSLDPSHLVELSTRVECSELQCSTVLWLRECYTRNVTECFNIRFWFSAEGLIGQVLQAGVIHSVQLPCCSNS